MKYIDTPNIKIRYL